MTVFAALAAFLVAATLLTITPGVDTAMVLRTAASDGARRAVAAGVGICLGCLVWGAGVALGRGAVLAASPLAFTLIKGAGAAYLVWLGIGLLRAPRRGLATGGGAATGSDWLALRRGLLTNLLNPKVGVFYITFLPQFVPAGVSVAGFSFLLAALHVALSLVWFGVLIAATVPLGRWLARPGVVTAMGRLTGLVFIGFGVRLALARR
jgi:threonine/homoserine/homoserine lactone efflux protein